MNGQSVRDPRLAARNWSVATDEQIFADKVVTWTEEDGDAFRREREKRLHQKRPEQQRIERERLERIRSVKEALQYTDELAQEICAQISAGGLLTSICRADDMPTMRRVQMWLKENPEFQALFNMSIQDRLFVFEEQILEIADSMQNDFKTMNGKEKRVADPDMVARAKLRIEVRFRHWRSGKPNKWGEGSTLITKSEDPLDAANLSTEELERRLADMEVKDKILRSVA